jgi:asparagine synthase (glutamine-hydrolysing)
MCGIAGIISLSGRPIPDAHKRVAEMNRLLHHRGPDGQGVFVSSDRLVALGNTRLAITDPGTPLDLPLRSADDNCVLTFNGEIYDYLEHRKHFESKGARLRTTTDTEVLLCGLQASGEDFLRDIDGMWAFAYYDARINQVILSRDLLGERHVFYRVVDGEFIFASEPLPILADRGKPEQIDWEGLVTSLRYYSAPPGRTLVKGLKRMLPGHNLQIDVGKGWSEYSHRLLHPEKWFDFFHSDPDIDAVSERFGELMHRASLRRLPQDVDYISTLSGGIDSTLVSLFASDFGKKPLKTLFGQSTETPARNLSDELDEYEASCLTAAKLNTQHRHIHLNSQACVPILERAAANGFDGIIDPGTSPFEMLAWEVSAQNLKVMLISDGPDETAGGYGIDRKSYEMDIQRKKSPLRHNFLRVLSSTRLGRGLMRQTPLKGDIIPPEFSYRPFHFSPIHQAAGQDYLAKIVDTDMSRSVAHHYGGAPSAYADIVEHLDATQIRALSYAQYSLPDMFNLRTDKAFLRASVECRLPFEAPEMAEFLIAMPASLRFGDGTNTKVLLRNIVDRHIGPKVAHRSKHGFAMPLHNTPEVRSKLRIEEAIAESSAFSDLPFRRNARDLVLAGRMNKMIWPFYVIAKTHSQMQSGQYQGTGN